MEVLRITDHAYEQAKKRFRYKKCTVDRMARIACEKGIKLQKLNNGVLQGYIIRRTERYSNTEIVIYGEIVYVFSKEGVLITMFEVPQKLKRNTNASQRKTCFSILEPL